MTDISLQSLVINNNFFITMDKPFTLITKYCPKINFMIITIWILNDSIQVTIIIIISYANKYSTLSRLENKTKVAFYSLYNSKKFS